MHCFTPDFVTHGCDTKLVNKYNKKAQLTQRERATAVHVLKAHCEQM